MMHFDIFLLDPTKNSLFFLFGVNYINKLVAFSSKKIEVNKLGLGMMLQYVYEINVACIIELIS